MGYKLPYDPAAVIRQINSALHEMNRMDGFTGFEIKKDLYQILWSAQNAVANAPKFMGEEEWLKKQEQNRIIRILKNDN